MGFIEEIAEVARRALTGDSWYVEGQAKHPYVLELRASPLAGVLLIPPIQFMVLPLGLQSYSVKRVYRQKITPTLGGLVVEERGELYKQISIMWDPGLKPKSSLDTSLLPDFYVPGVALSGPAWSRRMLWNYFDNYSKLKSDPQFATGSYMIWHDTKTDEHFVVVPTEATLSRAISSKFRYPLQLEFIAIGPADGILLPPTPASVLGKIKNTISDVNKGLSLASAAIQEGSAILGEVRYFVATIDQVLTNVDIIINSANSFVDGVTDTLSIGRTFITSTATILESAMGLMENAADIPNEVRQNYQMALDGLHTIAAQRDAFGDTYSTVAGRMSTAEAGNIGNASQAELTAAADGDPATSVGRFGSQALTKSTAALVAAGATPLQRVYARYGSFIDYVVRSQDTLQSIAANKLGDGSLWYDIAIVNGLKAPFISKAAMPSTAQPGTKIRVPVISAAGSDKVDQEDESIYLKDLRWVETGRSLPGQPRVSFAIDRSTLTDYQMIDGIDNLSQALQMRMWTERGSMPLVPDYGLRRTIGLKITQGAVEIIKVQVRETMLADPRVRLVKNVRIVVPDGHPDQVDINVDVVPIGETEARGIRAVVV